MDQLIEKIEYFYKKITEIEHFVSEPDFQQAIDEVLALLDKGTIRTCMPSQGKWETQLWIKKAILLAFHRYANQFIEGEFTHYYDKIPSKFLSFTAQTFKQTGLRVVPPSYVRYGAYIGRGTVLMPSFVNIGAYIGENCMIDTWATVGSCAQIGNQVHISGGAGIGGVLEPLQANPTIIEDRCFIGARSEIVEGVIVEQDSVISMGVYIGQSTKIYNRTTKEISYGRIPRGSVVVPGTLPSQDGHYQLQAAIIVKQIDDKTRSKVALNELLHQIAVES